jgi:hypothetical protein
MNKLILFIPVAFLLFLHIVQASSDRGEFQQQILASLEYQDYISKYLDWKFVGTNNISWWLQSQDPKRNLTHIEKIGNIWHIWNGLLNYYINDTGIQLTNQLNEYWTHNVWCIWSNSSEKKCFDGLNFSWNYNTDNLTYVDLNGTANYSNFTIKVRYYFADRYDRINVSLFIKNMGKNLQDVNFDWIVKEIKIGNTYENNNIHLYFLNNSENFLKLNDSLDLSYNQNEINRHYTLTGRNGCKLVDFWWDSFAWKNNEKYQMNFNLNIKSQIYQRNAPNNLKLYIGSFDGNEEVHMNFWWVDNPGCSGTPTACNKIYDDVTCGTCPHCEWDIDMGTCSGTAQACSLYTGQSSCQTCGCTWTADNNPPTLSYARENPTDPAIYVYGATYTFNVTVCDAQLVADISKVLFSWAGGANVSVTTYAAWNTTCRNYTTTKTDLAVQTATSYKWYANDSANAWASTLSDTYTVSKGTLAGTISSPDVNYPTSISATGSESNVGDTDVNYQTCCGSTCTAGKGPNTYAFGVGAYSCVFNTTAGTYANWTQSSNLQTDSVVNVNKGSTTATLYLNGSTSSQTSVYPNSTVNATATSSVSGLYVRIWRNNSLIANTTNTATNITQWGAYNNNFTAKVLGNANYSDSANVILWWNVSKGGTNTSLYLNDTAGNKSYNINDAANFTVSLNVSGKTVKLASNYTGWALQSGTTPLMNYTTLNSAGDWYNLTGYFEGDENYSASTRTYFFNVTTLTPTITIDSPSNISYSITTIWANVTLDKTGSWCGRSLDSGGNVTMSNDSTTHFYNQMTSLGEGGHNIIFYCNGTDGSMSSSNTIYFTVDTTFPTYSNNATNDTTAGKPVRFNLTMTDNFALNPNGQYIFGFDNCTGSFVNDSAVNFTSTPQTISVVKTINSTVGCTIRWYFNFSDNVTNWNGSLVLNPFSFTTISEYPQYSLNSTNSTMAGTPVEHRLKWTDNYGLSGYIFSFINGTNGTTTYNFSDTTNNKAYNNSVTTEPPTSLSPAGEQEFSSYTEIQSSNDVYYESNSTSHPYHKFNITINESVNSLTQINISWEGHTTASGTANLYVYNFTLGSWGSSLVSNTGATDFWLNKSFTSGFSDIINAGRMSILVQDPENWADSNCNYRRLLSFTKPFGTENLTNFPVLLVLNSTRINYTSTNATDIRFYDADNTTLLYKETELWNTSGNSYIWVKANVSNATTGFIWAYYNCSNSNADSKTNIWDVNFSMVQHLNETTGTHNDSTQYGINGTLTGTVGEGVSGKIAGSDAFAGAGYVNYGTPSWSSFTTATIEAWVYPNVTGAGQIFTASQGTTTNNYNEFYTYNNLVYADMYSTSSLWNFNNPMAINKWYHITLVQDGTSAKMYINGTLQANTGSTQWWSSLSGITTYREGNLYYNSGQYNYFNGWIDELRVSNISRSASWINASFLTESDQLITYGSEEAGAVESKVSTDFIEVKVTSGWVNDTWVPMTGTTNWSNATKVVNSQVGKTIYWKVYANDTSNNWNTSLEYSYLTTSAAQLQNITATQLISILSSIPIQSTFFKTLTGFFSTNIGLSRMLTLFKSLSDLLTFNIITSRIQSLIKILSSSFITNAISTRIFSSIRAISDFFSITSTVSRISTFYKSITSYFTTTTVSTRLLTSLRQLSNSFTISSTISRTLFSIRSITSSFIINTTTTRLGTLLRSITSYFTLNTVSTRVQLLIKSLTTSLSISTTYSRISTLYKTVSGYFTISQISSRLSSSLRYISTFLTTNLAISRTGLFFKSLSDTFSTNAAVSRIQTLIKTLPDSFVVSTVSTRLSQFSRLTSQSFSATAITSRIIGFIRLSSSIFTITTASARIQTLIKSVTDSFTINALITRIAEFTRITIQPLITSTLSSRISNFYRTISNSFLITESSSRIRTVLTSISQFLITTTSTSRIYSSLRSISSYFTTTFAIFRIPTRLISLSQLLSINLSSSRITVLFRTLSQSFTYSAASSRLATFLRSASQSFNTSAITSRLTNIIRSITAPLTFNTLSSRTGLFFKSISDMFNISSSITRGFTYLRSITSYFTVNSIISRISLMFRYLSQTFTINTASSRLTSIFRTISNTFNLTVTTSRITLLYRSIISSFLITETSSRVQSLIKSASDVISLNTISSRIYSYLKTVSGYFTISSTISRLTQNFRFITSSFIFTDTTESIRTVFRSITSYFAINSTISTLQSYIRSIVQSISSFLSLTAQQVGIYKQTVQLVLTITDAPSRIASIYRTIYDSFVTFTAIDRIRLVSRIITGFFTTNMAISRLLTGFRTLSDSLAISSTITRTLSIFRTISSSFIINSTTSRIATIFRYLSQTLSLNSITTNLSLYYRSITSYFTANAISTRILLSLRSLSNTLTISSISDRLTIIIRTISSSLNLNILSFRTGLFLRISSQQITATENAIYTTVRLILEYISESINISTTITRSLSTFKSITSYFTVNIALSRTQILLRSLSESTVFNDVLIRVSSLSRVVTDSFITTLIVSRIRLTSTHISQSFYISTISSRFSNFIRITSYSLTINQISSRTAFLLKSITAVTTLTDITGRVLIIPRTMSESFYLITTASRIQTLIRVISQPFTLQQTVTHIWWVFSKWFCFALGDEASCAYSGCYWCSGACQSTTCPTPTPPSGGGGGIWVPPTPVNVTVKTVLDTSVHVETPEVNPGDKVYAVITLMKVEGPDGVINVNISHWIKDSLGNIVGTKKTVVGVETIRSDIYYLVVPIGVSPGTYTFEALAQYNNETDFSFDNFQVVSKLIKPAIIIKRVDVPFILVNENTTIKVVIENQESRKIDFNITLLLPYNFIPQNTTKSHSLGPLSEDVIEFTFISKKSGSFTGFIKIEYEDKKVIKDFAIEVYAPEKFFIFLINYWWLIVLILIALLALFIYKKRDRLKREKIKYVFKRKDLLPKF